MKKFRAKVQKIGKKMPLIKNYSYLSPQVKLLSFRKIQIYLVFRSLIRNFARILY